MGSVDVNVLSVGNDGRSMGNTTHLMKGGSRRDRGNVADSRRLGGNCLIFTIKLSLLSWVNKIQLNAAKTS